MGQKKRWGVSKSMRWWIQKFGRTKPFHLNWKEPGTKQISPYSQGPRGWHDSIPEAVPSPTTPSFKPEHNTSLNVFHSIDFSPLPLPEPQAESSSSFSWIIPNNFSGFLSSVSCHHPLPHTKPFSMLCSESLSKHTNHVVTHISLTHARSLLESLQLIPDAITVKFKVLRRMYDPPFQPSPPLPLDSVPQPFWTSPGSLTGSCVSCLLAIIQDTSTSWNGLLLSFFPAKTSSLPTPQCDSNST